MTKLRWAELAGVLVLVAAVLAWAFWPAAPRPENTAPAPMVRQADGSVIAARSPASQPPAPTAMLPKGAVRERATRIVATPAAGASSIEIDTELVRMDNERRLIVSSPDGTINTAVDIPIDPPPVPPALKPWAAGLAYGTDHSVGLWVDRDIGKLVLGAQVTRQQDGKVQAQLRAGVRF